MKILSYRYNNVNKLGFLWNQKKIVDLELVVSKFKNSGQSNSKPNFEPFPEDLLSFIQNWDQVMPLVLEAERWFMENHKNFEVAEIIKNLSEIQVLAPISNPSKIICVGLNYRDHCREHHFQIPEHPVLFSKFSTSIIGPFDDISFSRINTQKVDYEAELAVIIKKKCRNITPDQAKDYIAGYTVLNDISARDAQFADVQWVRGKSFDTFCPIGPYLVTSEDVPDPQNLPIKCSLNNQIVQESNTSEMIFTCFEIVSFISQFSTLLPGDIIATGTPAGVGSARDPQIFLKNKDVVSVEIDGLGSLMNPVIEF